MIIVMSQEAILQPFQPISAKDYLVMPAVESIVSISLFNSGFREMLTITNIKYQPLVLPNTSLER